MRDPKPDTVAWCRQLATAFEERREEVVGKWWRAVDALASRRIFTNNRIDPDYLADTCVEPPRAAEIVNLVVSEVFNRRPKFFAQSATTAYEDWASWAEEAMNNDWSREYTTTREVKLCTIDCVQKGIGIAYTLPEIDFGQATRERRRRLTRAAKLRDDVRLGLAGLDDRALPEAALEWAEDGVEQNNLSRVGRIGTRRLDPWRVGFDWTAQSEHDLKSVWRWYYATKESVKRQKHWNEAAKRRLEYAAADGELFMQSVDGDPRKYVRLYEGWFRNADGKWDMRVWWEGSKEDDPFLYEADSPLEYGHPFRFLRWNENGSTMWCPSDMLHVYQSIVMERHVQTRMYDAMMRQSMDVTAVDGEVLTEDDIHPIEVDGVGTIFKIKNDKNVPLSQLFHKMERDPVPQESLAYLALLQRQIQDGLGLGVNQMLGYGKSETSATEAAEVTRAAQARMALRHSAMEEFVAGIAHDRLRLAVQFYDPAMVRALATPDPARLLDLNTFTAGDVQYGLHVSVVQGSMRPPSDEGRALALQNVLSLVLQGQPIAASLVNGPAVFLEWLKLLGIHDGSKLLMPGVTAQAVQTMAQFMAVNGGGAGGGSPASATGRSNASVGAA